MGIEVGGLLGLIVLVLDIWAIIKIIQSGTTALTKALWIVVILVLPVVGLILWYMLGRKS
ncbi:PLDc N-terminal domain-containing protein [Maritalea porphyrae]|uniref:Cardiolipin synthase N-terminal domain-containing protein n=1 Tax=Maritalea porphyrae TaxID=880732 RepID=A0ABQ5UN02_9HYPH|nr:PLDc N-terminal domain-containing protein [Maritalea porphyrae]GLQ15953.1 hypothetical protein GCM10007879_02020 [Maritalea porphyrae]